MSNKNLENFLIFNPWRKGDFRILEEHYTKRWLLQKIKASGAFENLDIIVVYGPRQVGKTTLFYMWMKNLIEAGTDPKNIFYFKADDPLIQTDFFDHFSSLHHFVKEYKNSGKAFVFCDEVQKIPNIGVFLKNLADLRDPELKIMVTGSSSLELRQKTHESLTGRKEVFCLYPFSFKEFLSEIKGRSDWQASIESESDFNEFVTYGGYPKVVLAKDISQKKSALNEIYTSYIQKDITDFLRIEHPDAFNRLVRLLADQIGNLLNIHELSSTLGMNRLTLEKYIHILEETFVIKRLPPFYKNPRKEITKMPKVYFLDTGLRNYIAGNLNTFPGERGDIGKVAENHVFTEYHKALSDLEKLYFWRTQTGAEVDFIFEKNENTFFPIEIKYAIAPSFPRAMRSFIETYPVKEAVLFQRSTGKDPFKLGSTEVISVPLRFCGLDHVGPYQSLPFHPPLSISTL